MGAFVFLDKLFIGCSSWLTLLIAAEFFLFLYVAIAKIKSAALKNQLNF